MYKIIHIPTALPIIEYVDFKHEYAKIIGPLDDYDFGLILFETEDSAKKYLDQYNGGYFRSTWCKSRNGLLLNMLGQFPIPSEHFEIIEV